MGRGLGLIHRTGIGTVGLLAGLASGVVAIAPGCSSDSPGLFGASSNTQAGGGGPGGSGGPANSSGSTGAGGVGTSGTGTTASGTGGMTGSSSAVASGAGGGPACTAAATKTYDFESGDEGFTHAPTSGIPSDDPWVRGTPAGMICSSGSNCWATNLDITGYSNCQTAELVSPVIDLSACAGSPQTITLSFEHYYIFEAPSMNRWYDGGAVQLSTDSGTTWTDVTTSQPYEGVIIGDYGSCSPLPEIAGHSGWSGTIPGGAWVHVTVDIPAMYRVAGFRIRWLFGADSGTRERGWIIDDVTLAAQ